MLGFTKFQLKELDILSEIDYLNNLLSKITDCDKANEIRSEIEHLKSKLRRLREG